MGFWGSLAKIGGGIADVAGLVVPGASTLGKVLKGAGSVGQVAGNIAGGMAEGRQVEQNQNLTADSIRQRAMEAEQQAQIQAAQLALKDQIDRGSLDLDQRKFALSAPGARASAVAKGSLMSGYQPLQFDRKGGSTGGYARGVFSGDTAAAGQELSRQSMLALMNGPEKFDPLKPVSAQINPGFTGTNAPQPGWWEKVMGGVGQAGSIMGALNQPRQPTPPTGYARGTVVPQVGGVDLYTPPPTARG